MVFRPRFFLLLSVGILLSILGAFLPGVLALVWPFYLLAFLVAAAEFYLAPKGSNIYLERRFDRVLSVRVPNLIRLTVTNDGDTPVAFRLRDECPPEFEAERREFDIKLNPGESRVLRYHVTPRDRGDFFFRDSFVRTTSPMGLVARQSRLPTREIVRVYPNVLALRKFDLLKQRGHLRQIGIRRSRLKGVGTDFDALREYAHGDDFRKIEWKASARRGKLIVKEFEAEKNQPVILVVDFGRMMLADVEKVEKLDHVIDASLMLSNAASNAGDMIGLMIYADKVQRWIPPKRGREQVGTVIEALHALRAEPIQADGKNAFSYLATRWKRRSLLVIFTELEDPESAKQMMTVLGPLAKRHICLAVNVSDPKMKSLMHPHVVTPSSAYVRTAALTFNEDRIHAQRILNEAGVRTLDAEPADLAAALVNYYLDIKATAQL